MVPLEDICYLLDHIVQPYEFTSAFYRSLAIDIFIDNLQYQFFN